MKKAAIIHYRYFKSFHFFRTNINQIAIVPQPVKIEQKTGYFTLPQNITIQTVETTDLKQTVVDLQKKLSVPTGYKVSVSGNAPTRNYKIRVE